MKKIFFVITVLVLVIVVTIFLNSQSTPIPPVAEVYTDLNSPVTPTPTAPNVPVSTPQGIVRVTDVTTLPEVVNVGDETFNLIGTRSDKTAGFAMTYSRQDNSYSIAILKEPIAENRIAASKYFVELLNISEADACKLSVYIGTTYDVSTTLSGQNFGLSFCPGATQL